MSKNKEKLKINGLLLIDKPLGFSSNQALSKIISISLDKLEEVLSSFVGLSNQIPPMFSALKHKGQPLYKLAREGVKIERQQRQIKISELKLLRYQKNIIKFSVSCSKGTYIRTLAEDIANKLGMDGYLIDLRRTKIGNLNVQDALSLDKIEALSTAKRINFIKPTEVLVDEHPKIILTESEENFIKNGQQIQFPKKVNPEIYRLFSKNSAFIGLGEIDSKNLLKAVRLISTNLN